MTEWVCVNCGARHESNNPPCLKCAGETFAKIEEDDGPEEIESSVMIEWECDTCGERHIRNNPPCNNCGAMQFQAIYQNEPSQQRNISNPPTETASTAKVGLTESSSSQGIMASAGDVLFNKSLTRQLIDLELLLITGFTWIFFLFTELIYHKWRLSNGEAEKSQYSYSGGKGEGYITKGAKILFWGQLALILLGVFLIVAAAII